MPKEIHHPPYTEDDLNELGKRLLKPIWGRLKLTKGFGGRPWTLKGVDGEIRGSLYLLGTEDGKISIVNVTKDGRLLHHKFALTGDTELGKEVEAVIENDGWIISKSTLKREPPIIVSACLAGIQCNYKGLAKPNSEVIKLVQDGKAIPVCPEQLGGLTTPRTPAERKENQVVTKDGKDVTAQFEKGAEEIYKLCELIACKKAILKARSPSCGAGKTYDGTFSEILIDRDGVLADDKWHPVLSAPDSIIATNKKAMRFTIDSRGKTSFSEPDVEPESELEAIFYLTPGAWAREGCDLVCKGNIVSGKRKVAVIFMSADEIGTFFKIDKPTEKEIPF